MSSPRPNKVHDRRGWTRLPWRKGAQGLTGISLLKVCGLGVLLYSLIILIFVATSGDIGIRCVLGTKLKDKVPPSFGWLNKAPRVNPGWREGGFRWTTSPPVLDSTILQIGEQPIAHYPGYVRALHHAVVDQPIHSPVEVRWSDPEGRRWVGMVRVERRPISVYLASLLWFLQELSIFAIGARVFWTRPRDDSARLFFWLCVVTVGAFMGGYHWSEIVIYPPLIYIFALCAIFLPPVSLHFYLTFPQPQTWFLERRRTILRILYSVPTVYLAALWLSMGYSRTIRDQSGPVVDRAILVVKTLALGYVGLAVLVFGATLVYLLTRFVTASNRAQRNQLRWILLATLLSTPLIAYVIREAWIDQGSLGRDRTAWPMYAVSLLYTAAYAVSITRYKLMDAEAIFRRTSLYMAAGLGYSALLVVVALVIGMKLENFSTSREARVVAVTALAMLALSGAARQQFQQAIDRRFHREKSKFDQAMGRMRLAVGSLVDRPTLGRRLLEAAADVLHVEWGAIYLSEVADQPPRLVACLGPEPDVPSLSIDDPLLTRLNKSPTFRLPTSHSAAADPAADAIIALGGEAAAALGSEQSLAGLLVLGPKRSGIPYEDEEVAFLGALASVAGLALHSAGIQRTLESLEESLQAKVEKIAEQQRRILVLQDQLMRRGDPGAAEDASGETPTIPILEERPAAFEAIRGSSPAVRELLEVTRKVATSPSAVLILGESGTGKELLAQAIHAGSPRAARPFVKVHCAALSQNLLESELFGHVRGAFTDAYRDRVGRFQEADGGTLFLDEIGDISPEVQIKLLRVLQAKSFEKVGSAQTIHVDVRVLAATHQDLEALIRTGRFRADLYYRLNVISLRTPSLSERKEDIFELAVHFLEGHARRIGKVITRIDDAAIEALIARDWPGNIRELENVIERAVVLADGPVIRPEDLPAAARPDPLSKRSAASSSSRKSRRGSSWDASPSSTTASTTRTNGSSLLDAEYLAFERIRLVDALQGAQGNISEAARLLSMPRSTFFSKLKKHGLVEGRTGPSPRSPTMT